MIKWACLVIVLFVSSQNCIAKSLEDQEREAAALIELIAEKQKEKSEAEKDSIEKEFRKEQYAQERESENQKVDATRQSGGLVGSDLFLSVVVTAIFYYIGHMIGLYFTDSVVRSKKFAAGVGAIIPLSLMWNAFNTAYTSWIVSSVLGFVVLLILTLRVAGAEKEKNDWRSELTTPELKSNFELRNDKPPPEQTGFWLDRADIVRTREPGGFKFEFLGEGLSIDVAIACLDASGALLPKDENGLGDYGVENNLTIPLLHDEFKNKEIVLAPCYMGYPEKPSNSLFAAWLRPNKFHEKVSYLFVFLSVNNVEEPYEENIRKGIKVNVSQTADSSSAQVLTFDVSRLAQDGEDGRIAVVGYIKRISGGKWVYLMPEDVYINADMYGIDQWFHESFDLNAY